VKRNGGATGTAGSPKIAGDRSTGKQTIAQKRFLSKLPTVPPESATSQGEPAFTCSMR
jgi:hypothetical protein